MIGKSEGIAAVFVLFGCCILGGTVEGTPTIEWQKAGAITYSPSYILSNRAPAVDKARGIEDSLVRVDMSSPAECPALDSWAWYIADVMSGSHVFADPKLRSYSKVGDICTFGAGQGSRVVKAKVWDLNSANGLITDNVSVDNAYLYSISGAAHDTRTLTMKYFTINNGWAVLPTRTAHMHTCNMPVDVTFDALTYGGYDARGHNGTHAGGCPDPAPMTEGHQYCINGNTPPYTKSDPNDERSYPTITSTTHDASADFGPHQIHFDDDTTVACGCSRGTGSNILIHGRVPDLTPLAQTNGCIRMHNPDINVLTDFYESKHGVWGADFHISVPSAPPM